MIEEINGIVFKVGKDTCLIELQKFKVFRQFPVVIDGNTYNYLKENEIPADDVTVFRILHAFVEKKLAKPIQFNEGKQRYEYADKPSHHHFICRSCGTIIDVTECTVSHMEKMLEHSEGVTVEHHSLEFFGLCKTCQS